MSVPDSYFKNMDRKTIIANYRNLVERLNQQPNTEKITKGDIFDIIDYLQDGLGNYLDNPGGRPYDDDEIINIREWVQRCCGWLHTVIKSMPQH